MQPLNLARHSVRPALALIGALLTASTGGAQGLGEPFCDAQPNSTGRPSAVVARGSRDIAQNNVTLACEALPTGSIGYFLVALDRTVAAVPGANGPLCLGGGLGRFSASPLQAGAAGTVSLPIDLTRLPSPAGPSQVEAGTCLHFQYWHRDSAAPTGATSAFSRATSVVFQPGSRFPWPMLGAQGRCENVAVGDLDGDGDLDLVSTNLFGSLALHENLGEGRFAAFRLFPTGGRTTGVELADLDGDGDLDVVAANSHDREVAVLWNDGALSFSASVAFGAGRSADRALPADLDGDGDLDLAVSSAEMGATVALLMNDGAGAFGPPRDTGWSARLIAVLDLDGDGDLDLVGYAAGVIEGRVNDGLGGFTTAAVGLITGATSGEFADLDGDGDRDFVGLRSSPSQAQVWRRDAAFVYVAEPALALPSGAGSTAVTLALPDFDGDGDRDLVAVVASGAALAFRFANDGTGVFSAAGTAPLGNGDIARARAGDLDGDGVDDVVVPNRNSESLSLLLSTGAPAPREVFADFGLRRAVATDLDRDGRLDLVIACAVPGVLGLHYGAGDGTFPVRGRLQTGFASCEHGLAAGDLDGDGAPDLVVGGEGTGLELWRNAGSGVFTPLGTIAGFGLFGSVAVAARFAAPTGLADFDGDGDLDVLLERSGDYSVALNSGGGAFAAPLILPLPPGSLREVGDMDGDGDLDFVSGAGVFRNDGGLTFTLLPASFAGDLDVVDLDGDGDLDVTAAGGSFGSFLVHWNDGSGAFVGAPEEFLPAGAPRTSVAGDLDGDSDIDLLVARPERRMLSVLFHLGDGELGLVESFQAPPSGAIAVTELRDPSLGDFDGDGRADLVYIAREGATRRVLLALQ